MTHNIVDFGVASMLAEVGGFLSSLMAIGAFIIGYWSPDNYFKHSLMGDIFYTTHHTGKEQKEKTFMRALEKKFLTPDFTEKKVELNEHLLTALKIRLKGQKPYKLSCWELFTKRYPPICLRKVIRKKHATLDKGIDRLNREFDLQKMYRNSLVLQQLVKSTMTPR